MTTQAIYDSLHSRITQRLFEMKGGEGSGNFNHQGRPGERGGSGEGSSDSNPVREGFAGVVDKSTNKLSQNEVIAADLRYSGVSIIKTFKDLPEGEGIREQYAEYVSEYKKIYLVESKMKGLSEEHVDQIVCHEVGHLFSDKYDRGSGFGTSWTKDRDSLGDKGRRVHTYFLRPEEAFAEASGLLLSGSKVTSQGRSADQFKKDWPLTMSHVKSRLEEVGYLQKDRKSLKGGAGSGNFNHAGRPGERGGSSSSGGGEGMRGGQDKEPAPTNNKFSFEMVDKKPVYGALNQFENNSVRSKDLVEVKISDLYSTQHRHEFSKTAVEEYRKKFEKDPDKAQGRDGAPVVMLYKGKMYLMNGHHRTAGASAAGRETIKVWLHTSKGKEEKKSLPPEYLKSTHTFASTQINIDNAQPDGPSISKRIRALARLITDDLLAEDGREDTPHITLKYGLESDSPAEVRRLLTNEHPINFTFGPVDVFEAEETGSDSDVVMLRIYSPDLVRLNKLLTDKTENETTFEYSPHCTLAYVLSGEGA